MFKVPSAWRAVTVDGYVDPSGGNRVSWNMEYYLRGKSQYSRPPRINLLNNVILH
jgi:hypothetical protein